MTEQIFEIGIQALGEHFNKAITDFLREAYWLAVKDLTEIEWKAACARSAQSSKFFPTADELLDFAGKPGGEAAGEAAWQKVMNGIAYVGSYGSIDFDPAINATIETMGGWQKLCERSGEDFYKWARKEFLAIYGNLRTRKFVAPAKLVGRVEEYNNRFGYPKAFPGPKRLGDIAQEQIERLAEGGQE